MRGHGRGRGWSLRVGKAGGETTDLLAKAQGRLKPERAGPLRVTLKDTLSELGWCEGSVSTLHEKDSLSI